MGLINTLLEALTGDRHPFTDSEALVRALEAFFLENGGLSGLQRRFVQNGHREIFDSWVASGKNACISPEQLREILGSVRVRQFAARLRIEHTQASRILAAYLPQIVDRLTPGGLIDPAAGTGSDLTEVLSSILPNFAGSRRNAA